MNYVPIVVEPVANGERAYDLYSRLLRDRIIFIGTGFSPDLANVVVGQLLYLESEDAAEDINIYINSPGGSVHAALAIYDVMKYVRPDIRTIAYGTAASAASLILTAGTPGKRLCLPHTKILLHQPHIMGHGITGQVTDIEIEAEQLVKTKEELHKIYSKLTGQNIRTIRKDLNRDYWLTPAEAIDYGLIDGIIDKR
jgi:ATP-dependent Clp protease protease subunit